MGRRVESLLRRGRAFSGASISQIAISGAALIGFAAVTCVMPRWIVSAQTSLPVFDAASIRPHTGDDTRFTFAERPGGRLDVTNSPISDVIDNAYGIMHYQLIGYPSWVGSDSYDIKAVGPTTAGHKERMLMLQSLLSERFAMKAHMETRKMPAFILTAAKGGPKVQFLSPEDCVPGDSTKPGAEDVPNVCGNNHASSNSWTATHISMPELVHTLSAVMGRVVIDRTDVKGTFNIRMQWSDDLAATKNADDTPPGIYSALRETLGLELKSGSEPVEVLVIDHIEKPTQN